MYRWTSAHSVLLKRSKACCQSSPFSQALMAALYVIAFRCTSSFILDSKNLEASCIYPPFSQALIAALQVITFRFSLSQLQKPLHIHSKMQSWLPVFAFRTSSDCSTGCDSVSLHNFIHRGFEALHLFEGKGLFDAPERNTNAIRFHGRPLFLTVCRIVQSSCHSRRAIHGSNSNAIRFHAGPYFLTVCRIVQSACHSRRAKHE
jgi:hypothetical protein